MNLVSELAPLQPGGPACAMMADVALSFPDFENPCDDFRKSPATAWLADVLDLVYVPRIVAMFGIEGEFGYFFLMLVVRW